MLKYELLPEQLVREGTVDESWFFTPVLPNRNHILKVHDRDYVEKLSLGHISRKEERVMGFPFSSQLWEREQIILQGSIDASRFAIDDGVAFNIAGGTHHAFTNRGEGFCILNDIAVSAQLLIDQGLAKQVLVIDLDVHQGNGTAEIFTNNDSVFTFSMHGERNYPLRKERSDLDVGLADGCDDHQYHNLLDEHLPLLINNLRPDFLFYQAGVDVLATDKLGRLGLTREGCRARDKKVLSLAHKHNIPISVSMGGGYSEKIADIVEAHANTFRTAVDLWF